MKVYLYLVYNSFTFFIFLTFIKTYIWRDLNCGKDNKSSFHFDGNYSDQLKRKLTYLKTLKIIKKHYF